MLRQCFFVFMLSVSFINFSHAAMHNSQIVEKFSEAENFVIQGENKKAISSYQAVIRLNPLLPEAYNNLAALYLKEHKTEQAKITLENGLKAHKAYGAIYKSLTAINVAMAREAYSKALQIKLKPADVNIKLLALRNDTLSKTKVNPVSKSVNITPKIPVEPIIQTKKSNDTIESILYAWAAAWSAQAVDMYLSFYHADYKPASGVSRKGWEKSRRTRLKKPKWIKINLSNIKINNKNNNQVEVIFKQAYQSDSYRDESSKKVVLLNTDTGWRIFSERSI